MSTARSAGGNLRRFTFLVSLIIITGCGKPAIKYTEGGGPTYDLKAEEEAVRAALRKPHPDPDYLRGVLGRFGGVVAHDKRRTPRTLTAGDLASLQAAIGCNENDIAEINRTEFTSLDGAVLDQSLLLRDIAKALGLGKADVPTKLRTALGWVTRHVPLVEHPGTAYPPEFVVTFGRGNAVERIYVYVAMLQQLGIEAYAIGDAASASDPSKLWGVAAVDATGLLVIDPRVGLPLPGKTAGAIANLADLQQDATVLKPWHDSGYDVTAERLKAARIFWALPASCFAPRLKAVEGLVPAGELHLGADVATVAKRATLAAWSPAALGTPLRVLTEFVPESRGGTEPAPARGQFSRREMALLGYVPIDGLPPELLRLRHPFAVSAQNVYADITLYDQTPGLAETIRRQQRMAEINRSMKSQEKEMPEGNLRSDIVYGIAASSLRKTANSGPTLRELLMRGQGIEATEAMVTIEGELRRLRDNKGAVEGAAKVAEFVTLLTAAQPSSGKDKAAKPDARLVELGTSVMQFVQAQAARRMLGRLALLAALEKHDLAEVSRRREPEMAAAAEGMAVQFWQAFLTNYADAPETAHAHRCLAEVYRQLGKTDAAQDQFRLVGAGNAHPLDKVAASIMAK